jgi:RecJ-like exonuclease
MNTIKGIVGSIKKDRGGSLYTIVADTPTEIFTDAELDIYDYVEVSFDGQSPASAIPVVKDESVKVLEKDGRQRYLEMVSSIHKKRLGVSSLFKDGRFGGVLNAMADRLDGAAKLFRTAYLTGAPMIIRFHSDGDGASGAIALYRAIGSMGARGGISWRIHKGVAHRPEALHDDSAFLDRWTSAEKPLILLIDFGTSKEGESTLEIKKEKYSRICIDHHIVYEGFPYEKFSFYINPWLAGGTSDLTAGTVAAAFAERLCGKGMRELAEISMISDHSVYAAGTDELRKKAFVLDAVTGFNIFGKTLSQLTPKYLDGLLADNERMDEIFRTSSAKMERLIDEGIGRASGYRSSLGFKVFVVDFSRLDKETAEGIPSGKYSSSLQDKIESENGPAVTIVQNRGSISLRCSKDIAGKAKILNMIKQMELSYDFVLGGGGHNEAASIRVATANSAEAIEALLEHLEANKRD